MRVFKRELTPISEVSEEEVNRLADIWWKAFPKQGCSFGAFMKRKGIDAYAY